jgi:hypothetical protein
MFTQRNLINYILKSAAVTVSMLVVAGVAVTVLSSKISTIGTSIQQQKILSAKLETQSEYYTNLKSQNAMLVATTPRIQAALLPTNNVLEFVGAVESTAARHSITHTMRFDTPVILNQTLGEPAVSIAQIDFNIGLQSNMHTLVEFIKGFEKLPYFARFNSITFTAQGQKGWKDTSQVSIKGTAFGFDSQ